jgi:hypothetical protein
VPEIPEAMNLSSLLSGLKVNCVIVELEVKVNTLCSESGVNAKLMVLLAPFMLDVFSVVALMR